MIISNDITNIFGEDRKLFADTVARYLLQKDAIAVMKHGEKIALDNGISVLLIETDGAEPLNKQLLEAHRIFNDLHYTLQGKDCISYKPVADCSNIHTAYVAEGDYILFNEFPVEKITVDEATFCFIPNSLAHMALYENHGPVRKLVFKIPAQD